MPFPLDFKGFRNRARSRLPCGLFEYIDRGTEAETALTTIRDHLDAVRLAPSVLTGHSARDISTTLMGERLDTPIIVAPTALAGLVAHNGEGKIARAADECGIPCCVSTQSTTAIEEIRDAAPAARLWFQLYVFRNRALTWQLLDRVRKAGVDTLVITADTPVAPIRTYNPANGFGVPVRPSVRLAYDLATHPRWTLGVMLRYLATSGMPSYGHYPPEFRSSISRAAIAEDVQLTQTLCWDDIREIRRKWPGRIVLKGILSRNDALKALNHGMDGIVVSAHGGRNLDIALTPVEALPAIAEAVAGRLALIADSGVRRGSDVAKYLALGAEAVMTGRLPLYGLAAGGEAGAKAILAMLLGELDTTLAFLGLRELAELRSAERFSTTGGG